MNFTMFAKEAISDFRTVGAVAPSSRFLVQAMVDPLPLKSAKVVVELGSGTGAMTRELLRRLPSDATLLAFEINQRFSDHLRSTVHDPRLVLITSSAENIVQELKARGYTHIDAAMSSLALGLMPDEVRLSIMNGLCALLTKSSVFTQFHYVHGLRVENGHLKRLKLDVILRHHFTSVRHKIVFRNIPPAFVFACTGPMMVASPV